MLRGVRLGRRASQGTAGLAAGASQHNGPVPPGASAPRDSDVNPSGQRAGTARLSSGGARVREAAPGPPERRAGRGLGRGQRRHRGEPHGRAGAGAARALVAAGLEPDPARAYLHAQAARRLAARVGVVRETSGIAAYRAGRWADALTELRAARRLTGRMSYLPLMADSERALGRLDRALELVTGPESPEVDRVTAVELRVVEAGSRRDQGLPEAGVAALRVAQLTRRPPRPGSARLYYPLADALLGPGREEEARDWFGKAAAADADDETDATERFEELDPVVFDYLGDPAEADEQEEGEGPADDDEAAGPGDIGDARTLG